MEIAMIEMDDSVTLEQVIAMPMGNDAEVRIKNPQRFIGWLKELKTLRDEKNKPSWHVEETNGSHLHRLICSMEYLAELATMLEGESMRKFDNQEDGVFPKDIFAWRGIYAIAEETAKFLRTEIYIKGDELK